MAARKTTAEWQAIEREYFAGEDSIREIADRYNVSEAAIRKRAKAERWERKVRSREPVRTLVAITAPRSSEPSAPRKPETAQEIADHARQLVGRMLDELDAVTSHPDELEIAIIEASVGEDAERRRDALMKAVSLPARSQIAKNLAGALKTINEAVAPQGKKAAAQERATAVGRKFGSIGAPTRTVN